MQVACLQERISESGADPLTLSLSLPVYSSIRESIVISITVIIQHLILATLSRLSPSTSKTPPLDVTVERQSDAARIISSDLDRCLPDARGRESLT